MPSKDTLLPVSLSCHLAPIHQRALILFIQTLALYKSFTYLLIYISMIGQTIERRQPTCINICAYVHFLSLEFLLTILAEQDATNNTNSYTLTANTF